MNNLFEENEEIALLAAVEGQSYKDVDIIFTWAIKSRVQETLLGMIIKELINVSVKNGEPVFSLRNT